jgi:hypothetical protein
MEPWQVMASFTPASRAGVQRLLDAVAASRSWLTAATACRTTTGTEVG